MLQFILSFIFLQANANAWTKIIDCNHGELVVDHLPHEDSQPRYQLVLRGAAFRYFLERNAIPAGNSKGEFILPVHRNLGNFTGLESARPSTGQHLFRIFRVIFDRPSRKVELIVSTGSRYFAETFISKSEFRDCL